MLKLILFFGFFMMSFAVTASAFASAFDCSVPLLKPIALAQSVIEVLEDGRIRFFIDYTTQEKKQRVIELPALISELSRKNNPELKVILVAGNADAPDSNVYTGTRHNLGFSFADALLENEPFIASRQAGGYLSPQPETVSVSYDDDSRRSWQQRFLTEPGYARTESGEVFYFENLYGSPVLLVKMLGDYNEVGDFAVSILDYLNVPSDRFLLVHDDLEVAQGEVALVQGQVAKYNGNNAVFSLIRTLSYRVADQIHALLKTELQERFNESDWNEFITDFIARAEIRQKNHLGQPNAYANAFKNVDTLMMSVQGLLKKIPVAVLSTDHVKALREKSSNSGKEVGVLMLKMRTPGLSPEEVAALQAQAKQLKDENAPLAQEIKEHEKAANALKDRFTAEIKLLIENRLRFSRLALGSQDGTAGKTVELIEYVLGAYPKEIYDAAYWQKAQRELRPFLEKRH